MITKQLLIGGYALLKLGSSRMTKGIEYLVNEDSQKVAFFHDEGKNIDYWNANGNSFFNEVWKLEEKNVGEIASPQALLELTSYAFVQHCLNGFFKKADEAEFDIKFVVREFNLWELKIAHNYISPEQISEVEKIIKSVKK